MNKLLVVRNDKLGDFVQSWPALAMLKQSAPDWQISALLPEYTAPLARICPFIDEVLIDAGKRGSAPARAATLAAVRAARFDAAINFFSDSYNALLVYRAGIPYRLAPATKLAQILYNQRLKQRRSRSEKPEFAYNIELAERFLHDFGLTPRPTAPPYLQPAADTVQAARQELAAQTGFAAVHPLIFVHAGTGGSGNNLSRPQYAALIDGLLAARPDWRVVLTAGPGEETQTRQLQQQCAQSDRIAIYVSTQGLPHFTGILSCAALFIAASTGTLHLASSLNCPTVGFYDEIAPNLALRWQPINAADRHLPLATPNAVAQRLNELPIDFVLPKVLAFADHWIGQAA